MNEVEKMLAADMPTIVADTEGLITEVNADFLKAFSWDIGALVGEPLTIIIPEKFHDAHNLSYSRFLTTGKSSIFEQWIPLEIVCGGGDIQVAKHFIVACDTAQGMRMAAHILPAETSAS
jgi:PAS domain S-box-containing protein